MIDAQAQKLLDDKEIADNIIVLTGAISYAARTHRMREALGMAETVLQLSHALIDGKVVSFRLHPVDKSDADDISRAMAVDAYIATQKFANWIKEDTPRD